MRIELYLADPFIVHQADTHSFTYTRTIFHVVLLKTRSKDCLLFLIDWPLWLVTDFSDLRRESRQGRERQHRHWPRLQDRSRSHGQGGKVFRVLDAVGRQQDLS